MPQPTLDQRFRQGPPARSQEDAHAWLNAEEQRFILWALRGKWSAARVGRALGVNEATVRRFRDRVREEPKLLLNLDLLEMVGPAANDEYRCLVCVERMTGRRSMERHVVGHFVEDSVVDSVLPRQRRGRSNGKHQSRQS